MSAPPPVLLSPAELAVRLWLEGPEGFGPGTAHPLVAVDLAGAGGDGAALAALPCPVIGIGRGPAARACDVVLDDARGLAAIAANVRAAPIAAMTAMQLLRLAEGLSPPAALAAESMAYATVQAGPEFRRWLADRPPPPAPPVEAGPALRVERAGGMLTLTLDRPADGNAIDAAMRDALVEALRLAAADDGIVRVVLTATGRVFSTGGALREFGIVSDPATAHWIRTLRLPATLLAAIGARVEARIDGAAIGAGLEMAAFAGRVIAGPAAWFQLPELRYGLIPGAGGTVSVARRIGRQRTAWMMLSMRRVTARTALDWGLVDAIGELPPSPAGR